jgi:hypothetical protein
MAAANPYQLSAADQAEIRNWATGYGFNPDAQVGEANKLLLSGAAASMDDLRNIVAGKGLPTAPKPVNTYTPVSTAAFAPPVTAAPPVASTAVGYDPAGYTPQNYTAKGYEAEGYTPTERGYETYDAQQAGQTMWNVTPEQTVEGRLQGLLAKGSPLLTLAETKAKQGMAGRGLLSSSMAEGEALRATTEAAMPIAQADAATFAGAAQFNAQTANVLAQFNVSQINAAEAFNANSANVALADNQRVVNSAAEFLANAKNMAASENTAAINRAAEFAAESANQANAAFALAQNNARALQAQAQNVANQQQAQAANQAAAQAAADANRARELAIAAENDARRYAADAANRKAEQDRLIAADRELAKLNQDAQRVSQTTQQAMDLYQQTTDTITKLMADPDLDPSSKQAAVDQQKANLNTGLQFLESATKIDGLSALLTFPAPTPTPAATTQAYSPVQYDDMASEYRLAEYMSGNG